MSQREDERLKKIIGKANPAKRKDIADLLETEIKRRGISSNSASPLAIKKPSTYGRSGVQQHQSEMHDMYNEIESKMHSSKKASIAKKSRRLRREAKVNSRKLQQLGTSIGKTAFEYGKSLSTNSILIGSVVLLGALKLGLSVGLIPQAKEAVAQSRKPIVLEEIQNVTLLEQAPVTKVSGSWTETDKQILSELDARRVELEKRREELEKKEQMLGLQAETLASRLAELRGLTSKLKEFRKQKDSLYEARLEQLANVYGSMAPNEAAPLIAKLEDDIGLSLLERMPGKRMGQILSMMPSERAIELTKSLTDKQLIR